MSAITSFVRIVSPDMEIIRTIYKLFLFLSTSPRITFHEERVAGEGTKHAGGGLEKNKLKPRSIAIEAFWNDS